MGGGVSLCPNTTADRITAPTLQHYSTQNPLANFKQEADDVLQRKQVLAVLFDTPEAFDTLCKQSKLRSVSYRNGIANEEVKTRIGNAIRPDEDLLTSVKRRKLK